MKLARCGRSDAGLPRPRSGTPRGTKAWRQIRQAAIGQPLGLPRLVAPLPEINDVQVRFSGSGDQPWVFKHQMGYPAKTFLAVNDLVSYENIGFTPFTNGILPGPVNVACSPLLLRLRALRDPAGDDNTRFSAPHSGLGLLTFNIRKRPCGRLSPLGQHRDRGWIRNLLKGICHRDTQPKAKVPAACTDLHSGSPGDAIFEPCDQFGGREAVATIEAAPSPQMQQVNGCIAARWQEPQTTGRLQQDTVEIPDIFRGQVGGLDARLRR